MPTLSLCLITYNEEKNIRRCLESACELADELIVVDSGSSDDTVRICRAMGALVLEYSWAGDFAAARNYALAAARGEWLLLLDADEELRLCDPAALKQYLAETAYDFLPLRLVHFCPPRPVEEQRAFFSTAPRLARRSVGPRFSGAIHEKLDTAGHSLAPARELAPLARVLHYGYLEAGGEKSARNLALLRAEQERGSDDPWLPYHLAVEYHRAGQAGLAFGELNRAIAAFLARQLSPPPLLYKLKYDILLAARLDEVALCGVSQALALYPDYVDLRFYQGVLQYRQQEYDQARQSFIHCLRLGESDERYVILAGCGSFLPLYFLGRCYEQQGAPEQAAAALAQAAALYPGYKRVAFGE